MGRSKRKKIYKIQVGGHQERTKNDVQWAVVDKDYFDQINQHRWSAKQDKYTTYARSGTSPIKSMHRYIMTLARGKIPAGLCVHHINGNGLDNRLENLALMTQAENLRYRKSWNKNGSRGIHYDAKNDLWKAILYIGSFTDKQEAIEAHGRLERIIKKDYLRTD